LNSSGFHLAKASLIQTYKNAQIDINITKDVSVFLNHTVILERTVSHHLLSLVFTIFSLLVWAKSASIVEVLHFSILLRPGLAASSSSFFAFSAAFSASLLAFSDSLAAFSDSLAFSSVFFLISSFVKAVHQFAIVSLSFFCLETALLYSSKAACSSGELV